MLNKLSRLRQPLPAICIKGFNHLNNQSLNSYPLINEVSIPASLSVVNMEYNGFYNRAKGLCRLLSEQADHFQFNRHNIKWVLENTGPSKIGVNISGELFTSIFSFSIGVNMPLALGIEIVDIALERAGLPE